MTKAYPPFVFFPRSRQPPQWVQSVTLAFDKAREGIDTTSGMNKTSDEVLAALRPHLESTGFAVETGKRKEEKLHRPVYFGEGGTWDVKYEIDAFHDEFNIVLEVEAGRSIMGNAIYRDLIQMSLMVDAKFAVIAMPQAYRYKSGGREVVNASYELGRNLLEAIYNSERLSLPFEGILLIGY
jgi:hypothetical protein